MDVEIKKGNITQLGLNYPNNKMMLKIIQINLQQSKCVTDNLQALLAEEDLDFALVQGFPPTALKKHSTQKITVSLDHVSLSKIILTYFYAHSLVQQT